MAEYRISGIWKKRGKYCAKLATKRGIASECIEKGF